MRSGLVILAVFIACPVCPAQPFSEESLNYVVNWPSGLSLGEGRLEARKARERWELSLSLEAALPGFAVNDQFRSIVTLNDFCSLEFEKQVAHGKRKGHERTSFDHRQALATRVTLGGGGKSEIPVPSCPHDALGFLYFLRRELSQGRLPPAQAIFFGAAYHIRLQYAGTQYLPMGDSRVEADRLTASLKGPASELSLEIFFARDAARTPLLARVPFPLGLFSMELVR